MHVPLSMSRIISTLYETTIQMSHIALLWGVMLCALP
jgi:hypothetical protein